MYICKLCIILISFIFIGCASNIDNTTTATPYSISSYNRSSWGSWKVSSCVDTRNRVLAEESKIPVKWNGCKVQSGEWEDIYTGKIYKSPSNLDIDHFVPLKEAFDSGAYNWPRDKKKLYYNYEEDPDHLVAVSSSANRSKGSKGPKDWLPLKNKCLYLKTWVKIKDKWELDIDYPSITYLLIENCK